MRILISIIFSIITILSGCTPITKVEEWRIVGKPANRINAPTIHKHRQVSDFNDTSNLKLGKFIDYPDSSTLLRSKNHKSLKTENENKYNSFFPPKFIALGLLKFYQTVLTQGIKTSCPFCITCSSYSVKSLKEYGLILGYFMTIDRLMRCNRGAGSQYFISVSQQINGKISIRRLCLIDEPAHNNIFNRKVRKK